MVSALQYSGMTKLRAGDMRGDKPACHGFVPAVSNEVRKYWDWRARANPASKQRCMSAPSSARLSRWFQAVLVILLGGLLTGLLFQRFSWAAWSRPHWLEGDPLEVYLRVKIAAEQPGHALWHFSQIARLGAPTGADWSAYPVPDRLVFVLTGLLSRLTGLFAAISLVGAFFTGLNVASVYLCARWLRCRWEWALAFGVVYAFCNYNVRWGITLSLSQTFTYPPLVLLCAWAARKRGPLRTTNGWKILAAVLGLWLGLGNPYLAYFAGLVAGGALLLALFRRNPWSRRIPLLVFLGCLVGCFLASNASYLGQRLSGATGLALPRNAGDFEVYALRPLEWFVPPADHRVTALAQVGQYWMTVRHATGEFFYNYLGLVGIVALIGLLAAGLIHVQRRQWSRLDPCLGLAWITAFGLVGGINSWLRLAGFELFRASTRIGIFAHVWVFFFAGLWLTRQSRRLPRLASVLAATALTLAACWEQTPPLNDDPVVGARNLARWQVYENAAARLEQMLPAGAAVFQLPVVPFPEAGRTIGMPDYEHALPFLASHTLRFSYGHLRASPALAWARYVSRLPVSDFVAALERAGFSALWLDKRGFSWLQVNEQAIAGEGVELVKALRGLGLKELVPPGPTLPVYIFQLHPAERPQAPDYHDPRLQEPWQESATPPGQPLLRALTGWFPLEKETTKQWRWATRGAKLGLWSDSATRVKLRFRLDGPAGSTVVLRQDVRTLQTFRPGPELQEFELSLAPGLTTLEWRLNGPTFRPGGADPRELGFMVENLSVSVP